MRARSVSSWVCVLAVSAVACAEHDDLVDTPIVALDYRDSFVEVRACRSSTEHGLVHVVVRANLEAAAAYEAGASPLPRGSVIVKEEYADSSCLQPNSWTIMKKEREGYFPGGGDWRWQKLDHRRRVLQDGRAERCVKCHAACQARDFVCAEP